MSASVAAPILKTALALQMQGGSVKEISESKFTDPNACKQRITITTVMFLAVATMMQPTTNVLLYALANFLAVGPRTHQFGG